MHKELNVDSIGLEKLKKIFKPGSNDHNMYLVYSIGKEEAAQLNNYIGMKFDFDHYIYQLDCFDDSLNK